MPRILDQINDPVDLKRLSLADLNSLSQEIREELVSTVFQTGGHLASNLGVVELTIALHSVFNSPADKIIWDVSHQCYVHKLLTGRKSRFGTIRQYGGLCGFTDPSESPHDPWGAGHASTSVSAALGMAIARDLKGEDHHVVAVIGDGAMTGGLAFEGVNQAGHLRSRLIVILNDNQMSISPNVGAMAWYLNRLRADPRYYQAKSVAEKRLTGSGIGRRLLHTLRQIKNSLKGMVIPTMIWEELGFTYLGPVDGHNIGTLRDTLGLAMGVTGRPVMVHVITTKGKGYNPAEEDAVQYHGVAPNGTKLSSAPTYTKVFGQTMCQIARQDKRVVAITPAMIPGTGLTDFSKEFPDRCFDVGIAEEHAVTFAAGLAAQGMKPFAAIYSTFVQRAYDQVVHDVCIQNLPVVIAMDRAGIVGDDGRTHQGIFDFSYLRHIPNLTIMAPADENELQAMLWTAHGLNTPCAIRYPRGAGVGVPLDDSPRTVPVGKAEVLRRGRDLAIVAIGTMVHPALAAAEQLATEGIDVAVINARFVKPLDRSLIAGVARNFNRLITVEENVLAGGFGSAVLELLEERALNEVIVKCIGLPDEFVEHGDPALLRAQHNLDAAGIAKVIRNTFPELRLLPREGFVDSPPPALPDGDTTIPVVQASPALALATMADALAPATPGPI
jgi:1-deoxy-D-xylulose-5-phosphate synthase